MQVSRRLCPLFGISALIETNKESILNGSLNVPLYQSDDKSQSARTPSSSEPIQDSMNQLGPSIRFNS